MADEERARDGAEEPLPAADDEDGPVGRTYVLVLSVELVALLALWAVGRHFGSL